MERQLLAAVMNNTFFGDGLVKGGLDEMPSIGHRDTIPCMHSGESEVRATRLVTRGQGGQLRRGPLRLI